MIKHILHYNYTILHEGMAYILKLQIKNFKKEQKTKITLWEKHIKKKKKSVCPSNCLQIGVLYFCLAEAVLDGLKKISPPLWMCDSEYCVARIIVAAINISFSLFLVLPTTVNINRLFSALWGKPGIYPKTCQDLFNNFIFELSILESLHFSSNVSSLDCWLCFLLCLRFPNRYAFYGMYSQDLPGIRSAEVASQNWLFIALVLYFSGPWDLVVTNCVSQVFSAGLFDFQFLPILDFYSFISSYLSVLSCTVLEQPAVLPRPSVRSCNVILMFVFSSNVSSAISVSRKVEFYQSS